MNPGVHPVLRRGAPRDFGDRVVVLVLREPEVGRRQPRVGNAHSADRAAAVEFPEREGEDQHVGKPDLPGGPEQLPASRRLADDQ